MDTDEARAQRVYRSLAPRLGQEGRRLAVYGFLTCLEERELHLWRFLRLGYDRGPWVVRDLTDDRVAVLTRAVGHLTGEAHLLKGFTRFSEQEGVLVGEIAPKNRGASPPPAPLLRPLSGGVLRPLRPHPPWEARFTGPGGGPSFPWRRSAPPPPAGEERDFRRLWRRFYDTIAIEGRENPRCRMTQMPKRFWGTMTEFQNEPEERKELAP